MLGIQEQEILNYFCRSASEWKKTPEPSSLKGNTERTQYLRQIVSERDQVSRALEVGPSNGEVLLDLSRAGIKTFGVNLMPHLVTASHRQAEAAGAALIYSSIFKYQPEGIVFDLISANDFLEQISEQQLVEFVAHARTLLAPGGSLLLSCPNRLYHAFALDGGTRAELSKGLLHKLIVEAMIFSSQDKIADVIDELLSTSDLLPSIDRVAPAESVRTEQGHYTPGQLVRLLAHLGFVTVDLLPLDYRGAVARFAEEHADAHAEIAVIVQKRARGCHYLIPFASQFMVRAQLK